MSKEAQNDSMIVMQCKRLHQDYPYKKMIIQFNFIENLRLMQIYLNWNPKISVFATIFLKTKVMANSVFCPGMATIISNLMLSTKFFNNSQHPSEKVEWFLEYANSCTQQIYSVKLSHTFLGLSFQKVCMMIYGGKTKDGQSGVLLIGIRTFLSSHKGQVLINPLNYVVRRNDCGILLATSQELAEFVGNFAEKLDLLASNKYSFGILENPMRFADQPIYKDIIQKQAEKLKAESTFGIN
jgi:hypothetical protein